MVTFEHKLAVLNQPGFDRAVHALFQALEGEGAGQNLTAADSELAQSNPKGFLAGQGIEMPDEMQIQVADLKSETGMNQIDCIGPCCVCAKHGDWVACA
jgi:hypothetical protein